jgi:hypothetical protein
VRWDCLSARFIPSTLCGHSGRNGSVARHGGRGLSSLDRKSRGGEDRKPHHDVMERRLFVSALDALTLSLKGGRFP